MYLVLRNRINTIFSKHPDFDAYKKYYIFKESNPLSGSSSYDDYMKQLINFNASQNRGAKSE